MRTRALAWAERLTLPFSDPAESLVVSGFPRSGTTWLMNATARAMRARTVFEAFHPLVPATAALRGHCPSVDRENVSWFFPFLPEAPAPDGPEWAFLERALRGALGGRTVRHREWRDALRTRVVVKVIRGTLALPGIRAAFGCPVLHIHRDPRAVAASFLRSAWGRRLAGALSLTRQLLEPEDGRQPAFLECEDLIRGADREGPAVRVATYWALTEAWLARHAPAAGIALLPYERLILEREPLLDATLSALGIVPAGAGDRLAGDSSTTAARRRGVDSATRIASWETELAAEDVRGIERVVGAAGLADRLFDRARERAH